MSFLIFSRCCQIPVLAFNVRFELQARVFARINGARAAGAGGRVRQVREAARFGAQIDVTHV